MLFEGFRSQPERWISGEYIKRDAFIPFSYGPANCIGKQVAYAESELCFSHTFFNSHISSDPVRAVASALLRKFEFDFVDGFNPQEWEDKIAAQYVKIPSLVTIHQSSML
jgi:hypothetical protein